MLCANPRLRLLLTGGFGDVSDAASEAETARRWLLRRMPEAESRLVTEERSRDTLDNLREARHLLPQGTIALLST